MLVVCQDARIATWPDFLAMSESETYGERRRMVNLRDTYQRPLRDLRISLIDRCNFRCPYCMPANVFGDDYPFLRREEWLSFDEIERFARLFCNGGVTKLRLTGGEPLLRKNLDELVRRLAALGGVEDLALTTNGVRLPQWAAKLADAGLGRLTISLDTLDPAVFRSMAGGKGTVEQVLAGIDAAERAGFNALKINAVVQRDVNDHTILDLLAHFRGSQHIVRLIEFMDVGNQNGWLLQQVVPNSEWIQKIHSRWPIRPLPGRYRGEVAQRYAYLDGQGEVGFISSVTQPFCGACNRARLTANGQFYTCLFATAGTDLRSPLRSGASDEELMALLGQTWSGRHDRYSEERGIDKRRTKVEMYQMGG